MTVQPGAPASSRKSPLPLSHSRLSLVISDILRNVEYWANLPTPYPLRIFLKPLVDLGN